MKKLFAGAVALLMCVAAFSGCNKDTHEHDFVYESVSATEHKITCTGCDYEEIKQHDLEYTKVDDTHHKITCKECDLDETASHNYLYEYVDQNNHNVTCQQCDLDKTTSHDYSYEYIDETSHKVTCEHCAEVNGTEQHKYSHNTDLDCDCGYVRDWLTTLSDSLSADGYVKDKISDFSQYEGTEAYRTVTTADELIQAIMDARWQYTNSWNAETLKVDQTLTKEGTVHVIEIANDLDLGFNHIGANYRAADENKSHSYVESYCRNKGSAISKFTMSDMYTEHGISKIKIENTNDLLIYSKNGAKLTHAGFSLLSCNNVVFRNIEMDEMWQWEDSSFASTGAVGDYDAFGWAYMKVAHCGYVWIDHCTFGKSYDGQIDYSNPVYNTQSTAVRAPYGADGSNGLHISWCNFNAGSDDPDGYLYKMMAKIEEDYQAGGTNYRYYNALREGGISFSDILYGIAIPQKKGFLCGDSGNNTTDYDMNLKLQVSFSNCVFKNLEDRLPKLRGGNAVMYNCIVDNLQYYGYRTNLRSANAAGKVAAVNSSWKCALVSQGIVCGNGGSFYGENCQFRGIETLLKNNDKGGTTEGDVVRPVAGGYKLVDCTYLVSANATPTDINFTNSSPSILNEGNFKWHTSDGNAPFEITVIRFSDVINMLWGAGVNKNFQERLLKSNYAE